MKFRDMKDIPESGGKNFVHLKDGESVTGIFRGDLHEFFAVWKDRKPLEVPQDSPGAKFRFRANFVVKDGAAYVPKIFEQGVTVYKTLAEISQDWPIEETLVKISRSGSSQNDTTYSVTPLPQKVPAETLEVLKTIKLNDLQSKVSTNGASGPDWPGSDDEIPF